jgi:hypothetical protein
LVAALLGPILLGTWTPSPEALQALRATIPAGDAPAIPAVGEWFRSLIPTNPVAAAAEGAIVPLTIFAILFGIAAARLPNDGGKPVIRGFEFVAEAMLVIVGWVLLLAPIGVFALAFGMAARLGLGAGAALAHYVGVQIAIALILGLAMYPLAVLAGRVGLGRFARSAAPAQAVAASTQSSLASLPPMLAGAERMGVPPATSSVILPLAVAVFRLAAPATIVIVALTMARMSGVEVGFQQMAIIVALATINTLVIAGLPNQITFFAAYAPPALAAGIPIELLPLFPRRRYDPGHLLHDHQRHRRPVGELGARPEQGSRRRDRRRLMPERFSFSISARDGAARTGVIAMKRGEVRTPAFMPVGTAATVKAMKPTDVRAAGADIILGNTYHLMLRPRAERVARLGGLHKFMGWDRLILTDSGGYQVMSLSELTKRNEEGVAFASHLDGTRHLITPERSTEIQRLLGSDIVMAFDELVPTTSTRDEQAAAMERSMRWARRSRDEFLRGGDHAEAAAQFGIQQGALDEELRRISAEKLIEIGFDGYAVGGLAVGEGQEAMFAVLDFAPRSASRGSAALPDGRRQARRHCRRGRARRRHVRLRSPDPLRTHGPGLHQPRPHQPQERPLRRGSGAARSRMLLPGLRHLDPSLHPPPHPLRRDPRRDADDRTQYRLLPAADGRPESRDRRRAAQGLRRYLPGKLW